MKTTFLTITLSVAFVGVSSFAYAGKGENNGNTRAPGQASEALELDVNEDGKFNGKDFAPGQLSAQFGNDPNDDDKANGKDWAPGQFK